MVPGGQHRAAWSAIVAVLLVAALGFVMLRNLSVVDRPSAAVPRGEPGSRAPYAGKTIVFLDSYHEGYEWSDGITDGIRTALEGSGVDLKIIRMDTKRNPDEEFKRRAGERAREEIDRLRPDVIIACDDNAFAHVVMPYYRDAAVPIVFCGLNWDASLYGAPYSNTTGMVEVSLTTQLISHLRAHARGNRIGYLSADTETERKNASYYDKLFGITFASTRFVKTMDGWEDAFLRMQDEVDVLIFENNAGIGDWDDARATAFAARHTAIPAGTTNPWIMGTVLIGLTKVPEEQGEWSARRALDILGGTAPGDIPVVTNVRGKVFLNFSLAEKLGVVFPPDLVKNAEVVR